MILVLFCKSLGVTFYLLIQIYALKVLAAHRYGIKRVILPERNLKDLVEVPSAVLGNLEVMFLVLFLCMVKVFQ